MNLRLQYIALILLVFGIALTVLSYSNLYSWNVQSFDSGTVTIAANSSNEHGFYTSFGPDLKKVQVSVDNVAGKGWINHPFEMSLLNGEGDAIMITTEPPPTAGYIFNVPNLWNSLGGVRVSNPEDYPVTVEVKVVFHSQTLNSSWQTAMIMGLIVAVIGIILMLMSIKKGRTSSSPTLKIS